MCECRSRIEQGLFDKYAPVIAEKGGTIQTASLTGYAMIFSGPVFSKQYMAAEITFVRMTKGNKNSPPKQVTKTETVNVTASYCMFCGEKYPTKEDEPAAEESTRED